MKLLLKRDNTSAGFPSSNQVDVGELVINSTTGKLYSKLEDGSIIEWIGQKICFEPVPTLKVYYGSIEIINDNINDFCCLGSIIEFEIDKLKPAPAKYSFELLELTSNTTPQNIQIQTPIYTLYNEQESSFRKALVPVNLSILIDNQPISIFKFIINDDSVVSKKIIEKIITIKCKN